MTAQAQPSLQLAASKLALDIGCRALQIFKKASYQDVLDAPPAKVAEVMHGRLYLMSRPAQPHATAGSSVGGNLYLPFDRGRGGPGGWRILNEPELHFDGPSGQVILVPDIAGWRRERFPRLQKTAYFTITPDWVCEILSPSTRRLDLGRKRDLYAEAGIPYLWLADPLAQTLDTFALEAGKWRPLDQLAGAADVRQPPFDAIAFPLSDLWDA